MSDIFSHHTWEQPRCKVSSEVHNSSKEDRDEGGRLEHHGIIGSYRPLPGSSSSLGGSSAACCIDVGSCGEMPTMMEDNRPESRHTDESAFCLRVHHTDNYIQNHADNRYMYFRGGAQPTTYSNAQNT